MNEATLSVGRFILAAATLLGIVGFMMQVQWSFVEWPRFRTEYRADHPQPQTPRASPPAGPAASLGGVRSPWQPLNQLGSSDHLKEGQAGPLPLIPLPPEEPIPLIPSPP